MTGIVRKIDDLGRIVIPKEIRKTLNVKSNDDIEIIADDNKIILKKYYILNSLDKILSHYLSIMDKYLFCDYIITDKEKIIAVSKKLRETIDDSNISTNLIQMLEQRKQILENAAKYLKINNSLVLNKCYYFSPIIINADILGSIILISDKSVTEKDTTIVDIILQLLKLKLEC